MSRCRGDRIISVGPTPSIPIPAGAIVHNASGRFVIPGLWDAHVDLSQVGPKAFPLLVSNGITSVRDMGSDFAEIQQWKAACAAGAPLPRIIAPGPKLYGGSLIERVGVRFTKWRRELRVVISAADARRTVDDLKAQGVDFIKIHNHLTPVLYDAIAQRDWDRISANASADAQYCAPLPTQTAIFPALIRAHTWFTPTLTSWRGNARVGDPTLTAWLAALAGSSATWPALRSHWDDMAGPTPTALDHELIAQFGALTAAASRAGVPLLAGTDLGDPYVIPGFALHDELALMVRAGVPILAALQSATSEPARAFGLTDIVGAVATGKAADLLVLDADPQRPAT